METLGDSDDVLVWEYPLDPGSKAVPPLTEDCIGVQSLAAVSVTLHEETVESVGPLRNTSAKSETIGTKSNLYAPFDSTKKTACTFLRR